LTEGGEPLMQSPATIGDENKKNSIIQKTEHHLISPVEVARAASRPAKKKGDRLRGRRCRVSAQADGRTGSR